jgi:hypothetical protein
MNGDVGSLKHIANRRLASRQALLDIVVGDNYHVRIGVLQLRLTAANQQDANYTQQNKHRDGHQRHSHGWMTRHAFNRSHLSALMNGIALFKPKKSFGHKSNNYCLF